MLFDDWMKSVAALEGLPNIDEWLYGDGDEYYFQSLIRLMVLEIEYCMDDDYDDDYYPAQDLVYGHYDDMSKEVTKDFIRYANEKQYFVVQYAPGCDDLDPEYQVINPPIKGVW